MVVTSIYENEEETKKEGETLKEMDINYLMKKITVEGNDMIEAIDAEKYEQVLQEWKMKIQELDPSERPREKALKQGLHTLSNRELLAVLLQSGTRQKSVLELADEVLKYCGT